MKIFLSNYRHEYNKEPIQRPRLSFCAQFNNFQRIPQRDVFISSRKKEPYMEEVMLATIEGSEDFLEESKEMLKATLAGSYYLNRAREYLHSLKNGTVSFETFSESTMSKIGPKYRELLKKALNEAGITSSESLIEVTRIFETLLKQQAGIVTHGKAIIEIYGQLENPKDLIAFPEILDDINFQNEFSNSKYDYNGIIDLMKFFGAKNEKEFFEIFSHLSPQFNDFEVIDDKFNAIEYIRSTYGIKRDAMSLIQIATPVLDDIDIDEFYRKNADIVDYLYSNNPKNFLEMLRKIMVYISTQEPISSSATKAMRDILDTKTASGKVELYDFLLNEEITATELNAMTQQTYYEGIKASDVVINRSEIVDGIINLFNSKEIPTRAFYACFAHILNVINKETERVFILDPTANLIEAVNQFELLDDKEFAKFYLSITKGNSKPQKSKKGQEKISQKDILNFIDLLSFLDSSMVEKYKKDKKYPLYLELKKKKIEFEKVENRIESELKRQKATRYFANSLDVFVEYYDLYKSSKNVESFIANATELRKKGLKEKIETNYSLYDALCFHFEDKKMLDDFLNKNDISLTRQSSYDALCLRIMVCLFKEKNKEEISELAKKLSKNDFILNSKKQLAKFVNPKSDEELEILFEIILNQNISSIQELNAILKPYLNKQKQISKFLAHFKAQNMDFESYLSKLARIQKDLTNLGFPITINNDNIEMVNFEELKGNKLNLTYACNLANKLLGVQNGNFVVGLENSLIAIHPKYSAKQLSKEITSSQTGRYKEPYNGFLEQFNLNAQDLGFNNASETNYQNAIQERFKNNLNPLQNFINSDIWLYNFEDGKIPNLSLHARMRLIDRFILQENKDLFSDSSIEELQNITKTIYTTTPYKMEKTGETFAMYFLHNDYEIKAIFDNNGQMITIAKNKL